MVLARLPGILMRSGYQTKTGAAVEVMGNTASGFILSYLTLMYVIAPMWNLDISHGDDFLITCIMTVLSLTRSYFWRRLMTKKLP